MDTPTLLSTALFLLALVAYREAWTPPTPSANDAIKVETKAGRILKHGLSRKISSVTKYIVAAHLLAEIFALWTSVKQLPFNLSPTGVNINSICPLATGSNVAARVYPTHRLSVPNILALSLIILGGFTRGSCHRRLGKMFTWETSLLKTHKLITSGPYQFVRHPAYTGLFCVCVGYGYFLWTPGTFGRECLIGDGFPPEINARSIAGILYGVWMLFHHSETIIFLVRRSFEEDQLLKREFGKDWDEWAQSVRWNIIPYII